MAAPVKLISPTREEREREKGEGEGNRGAGRVVEAAVQAAVVVKWEGRGCAFQPACS